MAQESSLKRMFRTFRVALAFALVHLTYNAWGISYYHWAVKPWWSQIFGDGKATSAGPNSVKAFVGVMVLAGWFFYLRVTRRKIGMIGILLTVAFFVTLGWMLSDYGLFPKLSSGLMTHIFLLILSLVLSLGVLLPEPRAKAIIAKEKPVPKGSEAA